MFWYIHTKGFLWDGQNGRPGLLGIEELLELAQHNFLTHLVVKHQSIHFLSMQVGNSISSSWLVLAPPGAGGLLLLILKLASSVQGYKVAGQLTPCHEAPIVQFDGRTLAVVLW